MWGSFVSIFRKEFIHITRDRGTLMLAFSLPVFQLLLFGYIDQTVKNLPTVVERSVEREIVRLTRR